MPNSYSTNLRWDQMDEGWGTLNTYSINLDPPTPSTFQDTINLYKQFVALGIINKEPDEDEPQDATMQSNMEKENSSMSTQSSMPPLKLHKDANTISSTLEPGTLLSNMALPLPLPLHLPSKQVVFYDINKHSIISEGTEPWRIIQHDIGEDEVLVHTEDFPAEASHTRLEMVLWTAMPVIPEVKLQHMHLHLENIIALYSNVKCTCISKTHGTSCNEPYGWATDLSAQDVLKWNKLCEHTIHKTIDTAVTLLKQAQDNPTWGNHYISNYEVLDCILTLQWIAKDLDVKCNNPMSTNNLCTTEHNSGFWLIQTSQGEFVTIQENLDEFNEPHLLHQH